MRHGKVIPHFMLIVGMALPMVGEAQAPVRDDAGVYAAVAGTVLDSTRQRIVVISSITRPSTGSFNGPSWQIVAEMRNVDTELARDFKERNAAPLPMPTLELRGIRTILTTDSIIASLAKIVTAAGVRRSSVEEYWEQFRQLFPDARGYILFGGVGYNADRSEAIVDYGYHCGGLCGSGGIFKLRKNDGTWTVIQQLVGWRA